MTDFRIAPWLMAGLTAPLERDALLRALKPKRSCDDCLLCCKLLPVPPVDKVANEWCRHAHRTGTHKGCAIYETRPEPCAVWSCQWVLKLDLPEALRPSRCHVVFDMMTDRIRALRTATGQPDLVEVAQMWCDPAYPTAHRAPVVRRMIELIADNAHMPTLARIGATRGFLISAPSLSGTGQWLEQDTQNANFETESV